MIDEPQCYSQETGEGIASQDVQASATPCEGSSESSDADVVVSLEKRIRASLVDLLK